MGRTIDLEPQVVMALDTLAMIKHCQLGHLIANKIEIGDVKAVQNVQIDDFVGQRLEQIVTCSSEIYEAKITLVNYRDNDGLMYLWRVMSVEITNKTMRHVNSERYALKGGDHPRDGGWAHLPIILDKRTNEPLRDARHQCPVVPPEETATELVPTVS